jgi:CHAT domain-containing protein
VLTGESATPRRFLDGIAGRTVVHVAAHALGNDADPDLSRLMLAADPDRHDTGVLFARDLYGRSFDSVQVVVLAACDTASGKLSRSEGPLSLARPFLAGGVPSVVATLWEIEDTSSAELLVRFHRAIASGHRPDEALRDAQIALIQGSDEALRDPRVWAAFEVVGGTAGTAASGKEG